MESPEAGQETLDSSEHEETATPRSKEQKTKAKRKTSIAPPKNNKRTRKRSIKRKSIVEQNGDAQVETPESTEACHSQSRKESLTTPKIDEKDLVGPLADIKVSEVGKMTAKDEDVKLEEKLNDYDQSNLDGTLDLSSFDLVDNDMHLIIQRVFRHENKKCLRLILRDNALTSAGIKLVVDQLLLTPRSQKNLGLSGNTHIGDAGIEHLSRLLLNNRSITLLALHNTGINDRGIRLLAQALCPVNTELSPSLEKVYVSFNKSIIDQSLDVLVRILEDNQTLKVLALQHCSLSEKARQRLRQVATKVKGKKFRLSE